MSTLCHVCGGQMECVEYCLTCNPDGLDITEETKLKGEVVDAAMRLRKFLHGSVIKVSAWDPALAELFASADALQAHREARAHV